MFSFKILGCTLLFLGLGVIFYSLFISYNIFTGHAQAPEIFEIKPQETSKISDTEKSVPSNKGLSQEDTQKILENQLQKQLQNVLPANLLPKLLNMVCWSILAGIFIFGGAQISGVGINLLKK